MSTYFKGVSISLAIVLFTTATAAVAANFPVLTISNNGVAVQVIVSNADINAPVLFYYPSNGVYSSVNIGQTNGSGYLSATINAGSYSLANGNPVYVRVDGEQSPTATWPNLSKSGPVSLYLSQSTVTVGLNQGTSVTASNVSGSLSVSGNNNPLVVSANISGNNIVNINGLSNAGTAALTICDSGNGSCGTINVTVQPSSLNSQGVYLNPNSITISNGQTQTISITGYASGPYYVSNNTGSSAVSAVVNGNSLIVNGLSSGMSNITVCATSGQCGTTFVNVTSNGNTVSNSSLPLALSSFFVSSGNQSNSFLVGGNQLTISFSANQSITNPSMSVGGTAVATNGSGSGPYTAIYAIKGNESMPLPVVVSFSNSAGATVREYFWTSASSVAPSSAPSNPVASSCPTGYTCAATTPSASTPTNGSYTFNRYLYIGMTPKGVSDPDVAALQRRLSADGFFSGAATGYFGPLTKAAVIAYQKKHNLSAIGVIGPGTRNLLNQGI